MKIPNIGDDFEAGRVTTLFSFLSNLKGIYENPQFHQNPLLKERLQIIFKNLVPIFKRCSSEVTHKIDSSYSLLRVNLIAFLIENCPFSLSEEFCNYVVSMVSPAEEQNTLATKFTLLVKFINAFSFGNFRSEPNMVGLITEIMRIFLEKSYDFSVSSEVDKLQRLVDSLVPSPNSTILRGNSHMNELRKALLHTYLRKGIESICRTPQPIWTCSFTKFLQLLFRSIHENLGGETFLEEFMGLSKSIVSNLGYGIAGYNFYKFFLTIFELAEKWNHEEKWMIFLTTTLHQNALFDSFLQRLISCIFLDFVLVLKSVHSAQDVKVLLDRWQVKLIGKINKEQIDRLVPKNWSESLCETWNSISPRLGKSHYTVDVNTTCTIIDFLKVLFQLLSCIMRFWIDSSTRTIILDEIKQVVEIIQIANDQDLKEELTIFLVCIGESEEEYLKLFGSE